MFTLTSEGTREPEVTARGRKRFSFLAAAALFGVGWAGAAGPTHVGGVIAANTTWTLAGSPYVLDSGVTVSAGVTLTLEPGVVVKGGNTDRFVQVYGTLSAQGTAGAPIYFTSLADDAVGGDTNGDGTATSPVPGQWGGVGFRGGSGGNVLSYVTVRFAGGIDWGFYHNAGVYTEVAALTLSHATLSDNAQQGLRPTAGIALNVTDSSFLRNTAWAIYCDDVACTSGTLRRNTASTNGANGIRVAGTLGTAATWEDTVPFVLEGGVGVASGKTLTIAPGAVVKGMLNAYLSVGGTLRADATGQAAIRFTAFTDDSAGGDTNGDGTASAPARAYWGGLGFYAGSSANVLANAAVRYAGAIDWGFYHNAGVYTQVSALTLDHVTIDASSQDGLSAASSAAPRVTNCTLSNNTRWAVFLDDPDSTTAGLNGNVATGNGVNGVRVSGWLDANATWDDGIPFVIDGGVAVNAGATLTIAPGRVVKANPGGGVKLTVHGTLDAQGTPTSRIVFTSLRDDSVGGDTNADGTASAPVAGDWQGLGLLAGSSSNVLANVTVRFGGNADWGFYHNATLWVETSALVASALAVSNSSSHGLGVKDAAAPQFNGCTFADNAADGARLGSGVVQMTSCTFTDNGGWALFCEYADASRALSGLGGSGNRYNAIRVAGNLSGSATWESSLPVVLDPHVNVLSGVTLTIRPGSVVKATSSAGRLAVVGTLRAAGAAGAPIVFTSIKDDAAGGDTNGDGTATGPARGDWGGLGFLSGSTGNIVSDAVVRYGGGHDWGYYRHGNVYSETAGLALSRVTLAQSLLEGYRGTSASATSFDGVTFTGNARWAGFFDDPDATAGTITGTVMTGNGTNGWRVDGTLEGTATWRDSAPFVVEANVTLAAGSRLEIRAGSIVQFTAGTTARIAVGGTLRAEGTESSPVTFTSLRDDSVGGDTNGDGAATAPAAGDFAGLGFYASATNSTLSHAVVRYAGNMDWGYYHNAIVYSETTGLTIADSTIADSASLGIYFQGGTVSLARSRVERCASFALRFGGPSLTGSITDCPAIDSFWYEVAGTRVTWTGNTFPSWGRRTSRAMVDEVGTITSGGNTFFGVAGAVLEAWGSAVTRDATWSDAAGPIVAISAFTVVGTDGGDALTTLTLGAGTTVRFASGQGLYVGDGGSVPGRLVVDGALGDVVFGSAEPLPWVGAWTGVNIRGNGRFTVRGLQVLWAATAVYAAGPFDVVDDLYVNRAGTGLYLVGVGAGREIGRLRFENCDIGFRASNAPVAIRASELVGRSWGAYNDTPGAVVDARYNWWGATNGPSGQGPGSGSRVGAGILFSDWLDKPADDGDGVPADSGHGYPYPCTCGITTNCDDNCPLVANPSQKDTDCDGVGDACDTNAVLTVSNDPADGADFPTIQDAVDATFESGSRIEIFPGLHPYVESVRVDRYQQYTFEGRDTETHAPVIVDAGIRPAFYVQNRVGSSPMRFSNLTLRGAKGIQSAVDTFVEKVTFDAVAGPALELSSGSHRLERSTITAGTAVGASVAAGARLDVSRTTARGCTDAGFIVAGTLELVNALVAGGNGGADGVRLGTGGVAHLRYATIIANTGAGVDNAAGGTATVERSVVYDNVQADLLNVPCTSVWWSDVGSPDCSPVNDNLHANPLLEADGALLDGSPCLDHGPSPVGYDGTPPTDLAGGPRLVDHDGSGLAQNDCGAFEKAAPPHVPAEVSGVVFLNRYTLAWDPVPSAAVYELYSGGLASLGYAYYGNCLGGTAAAQYVDWSEPGAGRGTFYLVTAKAAAGQEGTLGSGTSAERSNYNPCP